MTKQRNKNITTVPRRSLLLNLLFALLLVSALSPEKSCAAAKEFPAPRWLDKVFVSDQMTINGLPSSVQYFEAHRKKEDLLEFYRQRWQGRKPGFKEIETEEWHILSKLDGRYLYTLQVQESGPFQIRGYLSIGDLKLAQKEPFRNIDAPRMKGSRIINLSTSIDPGKMGTTLMILNDFSPESNAEYYRKHFLNRGWSKIMDMEQKKSMVLTFKRLNRETNLVISNIGGATQVVLNAVEVN